MLYNMLTEARDPQTHFLLFSVLLHLLYNSFQTSICHYSTYTIPALSQLQCLSDLSPNGVHWSNISDGLQQSMATCQSAVNMLQQRRQNPIVPTPEQIQASDRQDIDNVPVSGQRSASTYRVSRPPEQEFLNFFRAVFQTRQII
jgi:hypothetical protein